MNLYVFLAYSVQFPLIVPSNLKKPFIIQLFKNNFYSTSYGFARIVFCASTTDVINNTTT